MIVAFETVKLRRVCEDKGVAIAQLGIEVAANLRERLADIRAASTTADLLVGRPRGIIVGQLQHSGRLRRNQFNALKRRYSWNGVSLGTARRS